VQGVELAVRSAEREVAEDNADNLCAEAGDPFEPIEREPDRDHRAVRAAEHVRAAEERERGDNLQDPGVLPDRETRQRGPAGVHAAELQADLRGLPEHPGGDPAGASDQAAADPPERELLREPLRHRVLPEVLD